MTESQFMRNVRMSLPQYISNVTLFKQAERILINKGIISEIKAPIVEALNPANVVKLEKIVSKHVKDANDISKEMDAYSTRGGFPAFSDALQANLKRDDEFISWAQRTNDEEQLDKEIGESAGGTLDFSSGKLPVESPKKGETYLKNLKAGDKFSIKNLDYVVIKSTKDGVEVKYADGTGNMNFRGNAIVKPKIDMPGFEGTLDALDKISIREGLEGYYNQDGKEQYSKFDELDNMNAQEIMAGYVMEKIDNPNIDQKEAIKLVIKNLKKDQFYYTNYKLTGIRGAEPVEFLSTKRKAGFDQPEEVSKKADNLIDTKNATKVIKEGLDNRDIASQIYDELQNMGSYNDTDIDLKIKKQGLTGPDAEAVRMIIFDKDREDMNEAYKLLPDPSKVKLKELVRKMMKEMFDGRDNVTDVTGENN
jgi:hypothetical protein